MDLRKSGWNRWPALWPTACLIASFAACVEGPGELERYDPVSPLLLDPDLAIGHVEDTASFWSAARDDIDGGFYSFVEPDGTPSDDRRKSLVGQSRDAYGFARAFMLTGDEAYLDLADHALDFLEEHGWDDEHGGWWFTTDDTGELVPFAADWDPNTYRWSFVQHYALVGFAAVCEATRSERSCGWLRQGRELLDDRLWDDDEVLFGYYDEAALDWSDPRGKGFTPTVDAVTTHELAAYLLDGDEPSRTRLLQLSDNMRDHLAGNLEAPEVELGFPEVFDSDWAIDRGATTGQPGHVLKTAWCLARVHGLDPDAGYLDAALRLLRDTYDNGGYDAHHGGPYHEVDWSSGRVSSSDKVHWVLEQAVTAGLLIDHLAGEPTALFMADQSLGFYMSHMVDPEYGEAWSQTSQDGSVVTDPSKGDAFKAAYHSIELGYYTYLYGNLLLQDRAVTLHYAFEPSTDDRELLLRPLSLPAGPLSIASVTLDGEPFWDFTSTSLHVPADTSGTFAVVFSTQ